MDFIQRYKIGERDIETHKNNQIYIGLILTNLHPIFFSTILARRFPLYKKSLKLQVHLNNSKP